MRPYALLLVIAGAIATLGSQCPPTRGSMDCTMLSQGNPTKYVVSSITLPMSRSDFSIDLNGDGKTDNQLGNIMPVLAMLGLDLQSTINSAVTPDGTVLLLLDRTSDDPTGQMSTCAGTELQQAVVTPNPDLTGSGSFTVDTIQGGLAEFGGPISNGRFSSNNPVTTTHPVTLQLSLPIVAGVTPVVLDVIGAHLVYTNGTSGLMGGQLQGAVDAGVFRNTLLPAIAAMLTQRVAMAPSDTVSQHLLAAFDDGGGTPACTNVSGSQAVAGDGRIDDCEIFYNAMLKNVFDPDVQMYSSAIGMPYGPNPDNTQKDSLSFAVGFTAVKASY
jgi:hypothetical protein